MTKDQIIKMLEQFDGDDHISFDGVTRLYNPEHICGKGQKYMSYLCVLPLNHVGECFCSSKNVEFIPD